MVRGSGPVGPHPSKGGVVRSESSPGSDWGPPSGGRADRRNPERVVVFRRDMFPPGPFDGPCGTCLGIVFYLNDGLVAGFVHRIFHL